MKRHSLLASLLAASTILGGVAYAADQSAALPPAQQESAAQKSVDRDVVKLSADGAAAFRDMHLARVAIFNADPAQAKDLIGKAQSALDKAKSDESVFTKAEADLKQPANGKMESKPADGSKSASDNGNASNSDAGKPIAWLPVDGQLTLGEDFVATPQKAKGVSDANRSLEKGDRKGAVEKLKLAGIDVDFTMAVLPLDKTTSDVDQAAKLLNDSKYYEANAVLKQAEDGMRFDVIDTTAVPQKGAANAASHSGQASSGAAKSSTH